MTQTPAAKQKETRTKVTEVHKEKKVGCLGGRRQVQEQLQHERKAGRPGKHPKPAIMAGLSRDKQSV